MARLATAAAAAFVVLAVVATTMLVRPLGVAGPATPPPSQVAAGATPTASVDAPSGSFGPARPASWRVDPSAQIGPESRSIPLLVTEIECASGQSPEGRILDPVIEYRADAVVISISIYTDPGDCPSNPEYPLTVELSEPLGDRLLLGGRAEPMTHATPTPPLQDGPSPSPDAWGYPVPERWGYFAETDSGLSVHVRPDLDSPIQDTGVSTFYVLGEQMVDGQPWLRVEYWLHREEMVFGWLPAAAGSLSRLDLVCRDPILGEMGVDPAHTGECYAGKTLEIGPVLIRRDDGRSVVRGEPAWLAERPRFALYNLRPPDDQASAGPPVALAGSPAGIAPLTAYVLPKIQVHLPPELAEIPLPEGWVTVTAHVGDPRSADCRRDAAASGFSEETPFEQELWCRQQIVISAITPSEPPPSLRPDDGPSY